MSCVEVISTNVLTDSNAGNGLFRQPGDHVIAPSRPSVHQEAEEEIHLPHLPPLLRGHPDIHLRNGVMRAARLAAIQEVDAEKAFFVADLSCVYKQHEKWKRHLPHIEPFYGACSRSLCIQDLLLKPCVQPSNATLTHTCYGSLRLSGQDSIAHPAMRSQEFLIWES